MGCHAVYCHCVTSTSVVGICHAATPHWTGQANLEARVTGGSGQLVSQQTEVSHVTDGDTSRRHVLRLFTLSLYNVNLLVLVRY